MTKPYKLEELEAMGPDGIDRALTQAGRNQAMGESIEEKPPAPRNWRIPSPVVRLDR